MLVVEDDRWQRQLLEEELRSHGYATRSAGSGAEALGAIATRMPDLAVADLAMPGMDGIELLGHPQSRGRGARHERLERLGAEPPWSGA